jgi:hypothetical protein
VLSCMFVVVVLLLLVDPLVPIVLPRDVVRPRIYGRCSHKQ